MAVIVHTLDPGPDDQLLATWVGVAGYVLKSIRPARLLQVIGQVDQTWQREPGPLDQAFEHARNVRAEARLAVRRSRELRALVEQQRLSAGQRLPGPQAGEAAGSGIPPRNLRALPGTTDRVPRGEQA